MSGDGIFPDTGSIAHVIIKTPGGDVADDVDGLTLLVTDLAADIDFGDHEPGDDDLAGDDGNDDLSGGGGDDSLSGDEGDDDLHGQGGDDDLSGGGGDDHLAGSGGKDDLSGGDGNDLLKGQGKNDRLDGGADDDTLVGGGGKDVYIFALDFGSDTIKRFDHGKDKIDLSQAGLTFDDLTITRAHGDTIVTSTEGTITIDHVSGGKTVDQGDFLF